MIKNNLEHKAASSILFVVAVVVKTNMAPSNAGEEDVKLTAEEARQLEQAFKDDEFRKLMAEYVTEISDPNFKAEQEAYITQLESQNEVPLGKALVRPSRYAIIVLTFCHLDDLLS